MSRTLPVPVLLLAAIGLPVWGQPPPAPVGYTEAARLELAETVRLTGSVEARRSSVVASEVQGLVLELAAREGDFVRRGEPLVKLRRTHLELQLDSARAELKEAEARKDLASRNLERARELFDSSVISRQGLDDAFSEQTAWEGRVERLRAEIAKVQDDLDRSVVAAPFTGFVIREHTQVGEWLGVGGEVVELLDLEELEVVVEVPERYFGALEEGAETEIRVEALSGFVTPGRIAAVIPRADPQARTFPVKIRFPNQEHRVGVGMLAQVSVPLGEIRDVLVVPKDAVVRRGAQILVYRIGAEEAAEPVEVVTGAGAGAWVEVSGKLAAGDRVVTRGNERLRPGQPLEASRVEYDLP